MWKTLTREMKDSGVEWIGEIPKEWDVTKFKYVANLYTGVSIKDSDKDDYIFEEEAYPYIATKDVEFNTNSVDFSNTLFTKKNDEKFKVAKAGSSLICIEGGNAGRKKAYLDRDVTFGNKLCCLEPLRVKDRYLNYFINSQVFENHFYNQMRGMISGVSVSALKNFNIPIPPESEQKKIINFLKQKVSTINKIIQSTISSVEELKKYKQSLITEAVTKGLNPNVEMKDSGIEWIGQVPRKWQVIKINQLFSIKKVIANQLGLDVFSVTQNGLKIRDVTKNEGQMSADYSKYQIVEKEDFVMNHMDLLTGWVDIAEQKGVTSPDYRVFYNKQRDKVFNKYFLYVLQLGYMNKIFFGLGQGVSNAGRWRLQTDKFLNYYVPLPSREEQEEIVNYLNHKNKVINKLIKEKELLLDELESFKKSLIYEYVTGKKTV